MGELEDYFDQAAPAVEERARLIRAVEQYQEYLDNYPDPYPHCDERVLHSPGTCRFCDMTPELQQYREMCGLPYTDFLQAKDALLPGETRTRASAEAWGGNKKG